MKTLDKYITKNFLIGYLIAFLVLMGLRIMIDLFVNIDEFTEHADLNFFQTLWNITLYYGRHGFLYFRDFAGMITVVAAVFSLGKMTKNNELIAIMASGVSLKRIIAPIMFMSVALTFIHIIDQEFFIPPMADKLVRSHDAVAEKLYYDMWFISDGNGSLFCSPQFKVKEEVIVSPTIITRSARDETGLYDVTGIVRADSAHYNADIASWVLENGIWLKVVRRQSDKPYEAVTNFASDLKPKDIPVRRKSAHMDLLSSYDLIKLARQNPKDLARLYAQKNFRLTDPIINLVMLIISLPVLVCRDPKSLKSAVFISFALTGLCYIMTFICKVFASEVIIAGRALPELWAWLPIFVFLPIAFIELDSMKT
ncbi:MAG: LptF/LptG family permease [Sedimentisphaerales bacterium]|nr:LptF/LptG family permease [Sedimentisphaerales bacterium]